MPSTAVRTIDYDAPRDQLWVTFVSGKTYVYDRVPPDVYDAFVSAPSKGTFFNRFVRDRFPHRQVKNAS